MERYDNTDDCDYDKSYISYDFLFVFNSNHICMFVLVILTTYFLSGGFDFQHGVSCWCSIVYSSG